MLHAACSTCFQTFSNDPRRERVALHSHSCCALRLEVSTTHQLLQMHIEHINIHYVCLLHWFEPLCTLCMSSMPKTVSASLPPWFFNGCYTEHNWYAYIWGYPVYSTRCSAALSRSRCSAVLSRSQTSYGKGIAMQLDPECSGSGHRDDRTREHNSMREGRLLRWLVLWLRTRSV